MSKTASQTRATTLTVDERGVATLTIDCPGSKLNVLSPDVFRELSERTDEVTANEAIVALVVLSGKPGSFVAGADIGHLATIRTVEEGTEMSAQAQAVLQRFADLKVPTVCAIDGVCLGGGLEWALACSHRLASDSNGTQLGLPEVQLGLIPGAGGTQRLPRLVGFAEALELVLTGKRVRPHKARKLGLVDEVVPVKLLPSRARAAALELVEGDGKAWQIQDNRHKALTTRIAESYGVRSAIYTKAKADLKEKTRGHYPAPMLALEVVRTALRTSLPEGLAEEARLFGEASATAESSSLIHLFNTTTELKSDSGLDTDMVPETVDFDRAAVIGAGLMGSGIATVLSDVGVKARVKDVSSENLSKMYRYLDKYLQKKVQRRHYSEFDRSVRHSRVTATTDFSGFSQCGIVLEAVFEDVSLKSQVLKEVEAVTSDRTIFASNTSSLPISKLAEASSRPEQVVGMHFFSPVEKMQLVEVIVTDKTADWVTASTVALAKKMKKHTIVVRDGAGFYTSRILAALCNEAVRCLYDGATIESIDKALENFGFPVGPMRLMDEVGIGVVTKVMGIMSAAFPNRFEAPAGWEKVLEGRQGKSSGKGFYRYNGKQRTPDRSVYKALPRPERTPMSAEDIADRCVFAFLNECALCLEEGILRNPRDGDVGAVFGLGFPPFLGGPFFAMDQLGMDNVMRRFEELRSEFGPRFQPAESLKQMKKDGSTFF